jgi:hypothetical protein
VRREFAASSIDTSRSTLVLVTLFALLMASLSGAAPSISGPAASTNTGLTVDWSSMLLQAAGPHSAAGGMGDGSQPWHDCARFEAVVIAVGVNSGCRSGLSDDSLPVGYSVATTVRTHRSLCATSCGVSSSLGRQFTLVGAKPSGTS